MDPPDSNSSGINPENRLVANQTIAGATAGIMTSLISCPLDVVKTRLQSQLPHSPGIITDGPKKYKGTIPSIMRIWREEGGRGLYRGLGPSLFGYLPTFAIYFPAYNRAKHLITFYCTLTYVIFI